VTTADTVMADVSDGAAVLVQAGNASQLAEALDEVLRSGYSRKNALGLEVAARYTWAASAEKHIQAYRTAVKNRR